MNMREILNSILKSKTGLSIAAVGAWCLLFNCQSPVEKPDPASDLIEFESVWQYLKAFSIHQDAVPADPFAFAAPYMLMDAVHDTLGGIIGIVNNYTHYYDEQPAGASASLSASTALSANPPTVFLDHLTDSTACITDTGFESWTFRDFYNCAINAAGYPNIVIDLRHNRGGQLDVLDSIIESMVPAGTSYIEVQDREFDKKTKSYITTNWHPLVTKEEFLQPWFNGKKKKYVVIMDSMTASASEMLASAMYEGDSTKLIGTKSYGKGMGQIILDRRTRQSIQITFMYMRGVNRSAVPGEYASRIDKYHRIGIKPDPVPDSIIKSAATGTNWNAWQKEIYYAAKMLEKNLTPSKMIADPPLCRFNLKSYSKVSSGLYKVIKEEDVEK